MPRALNAWEQARGFAANTPEAAPELESKQGGRRKKKDSFRMTQASVPVERVTVGPIDTFKPVAVLPEEQVCFQVSAPQSEILSKYSTRL